jgi:hypothetical protein
MVVRITWPPLTPPSPSAGKRQIPIQSHHGTNLVTQPPQVLRNSAAELRQSKISALGVDRDLGAIVAQANLSIWTPTLRSFEGAQLAEDVHTKSVSTFENDKHLQSLTHPQADLANR